MPQRYAHEDATLFCTWFDSAAHLLPTGHQWRQLQPLPPRAGLGVAPDPTASFLFPTECVRRLNLAVVSSTYTTVVFVNRADPSSVQVVLPGLPERRAQTSLHAGTEQLSTWGHVQQWIVLQSGLHTAPCHGTGHLVVMGPWKLRSSDGHLAPCPHPQPLQCCTLRPCSEHATPHPLLRPCSEHATPLRR